MVNEIYDLPTPKDFGLEFNYASWPHNSEVTLCNVNWNNDYRDVVRFANQDALNTYLEENSGPSITMNDLTNVRWGEPIDLDIPLSIAQEFNYIKVTNPAFPITGDKAKSYYYFIQHVQFIAGNNTRLYVQLDAWQTFAYTTVFGNCYVEKGHVGIANQNSFDNFGRDYLTVPEGMDIGSEYQIMDILSRSIATAGFYPSDDYKSYDIMIVSTVTLAGVFLGGDDEDSKPVVNSAKGSILENIASGAEIYFMDTGNFDRLMKVMSTRPWISQGIISITAVPELSIYQVPTEDVMIYGGDDGIVNARKPLDTAGGIHPNVKVKHTLQGSWRDNVLARIPARYRGLKKLLTAPYMMLELTSQTGTPLALKPESWNDADAKVVEVPSYSPSGARLMFYPYRYNASPTGLAPIEFSNGVYQDGGEGLDMATGIFNFPQLPLVNNGYLSYMASNKNSIAFQHASADWSQQKAIMGADQAVSNTAQSVQTSGELNRIGNDTAQASTALGNDTLIKHTIVGGVAGVIRGTASNGVGGFVSGVGGALESGINAAININANNNQTGLNVSGSRLANNASNELATNIADSNRALAGRVASGDYAQAIAGINARVQDAKMIQPTTSGQIGGDSFLLSNYKWGYDLKIKMLGGSALRSVGEYFLRYGYSVNRFMRLPGNLMCMSKFTYWKLSETYIIASKCPEEYRQTLRGIMEKGVTVWADPNDIGQIDIADNQPLAGIAY